jgi:hypothetical protein
MSNSQFAAFKKSFDFDEKPTHDLLCCWECEQFIAITFEDGDKSQCPVCGEFGEWISSLKEWPKRCMREGCDKKDKWVEDDTCYGVWGKKKKAECKYETFAFDEDIAWGKAVIEAEDETTVPGLARLKNLIIAANGWDTSHHKDKKGSHTASEKATHAKGDQQDKSQKDTKIRFINEAMEKVTDNYKSPNDYPSEVESTLEDAVKAIKRLEKM